jgi:hypothetical protein
MTGEEIANKAWDRSEEFGKCNKFAGAVATEILKEALASEGIPTSVRDVFIKGLPIEWDLVVPRAHAAPALNGLLYESSDVVCALEIKLSGLHSQEDVPRMSQKFERAKSLGISCVYVTIGERETYRHRATSENLGFPAFTLMWHRAEPVDTGDWKKLLSFLKTQISGA